MAYSSTTSSDKELTAFIKAVVNAENRALVNGIPSPDLPLNNGKSLEGCGQLNDDFIVENAADEIQLRAVYYSCNGANNEKWAHSYDCTNNAQGNLSSTWNEYDFCRGNPSNQASVSCNLENDYPVIYPMQVDLQVQKLPYRPINLTSGKSDEDTLIIDEFLSSHPAKHSNPQPLYPPRRTPSPRKTNHGTDYSKDEFNTEKMSVDKHGCKLIENWFNSLPIESNEIRLKTREDCLHESGANHSTMFPDYSNMSNASGNVRNRNIETVFTGVHEKTSVRPRPRPYSVKKDCCSLAKNSERNSLFKADTRIEKLRADVFNIYQRYNQDERSVVSSIPKPQLAADTFYSEYERRVELRPNTMYNPRFEQSGDAFNSFLQVKQTNCLPRSPVYQNGKMQADYGQKLTHLDLPVIKQSTMMSRRQRQTIKMQEFMNASQCKATPMIDQPTSLSQFNRAVIQAGKVYTSSIDQTSSVLSKRKNCETNEVTAEGQSLERGTCRRKRKGEVSGEASSVISPATVRPGTPLSNVKEELGFRDSNGHRNQKLSHAIDGSFQQMKNHVPCGISRNLITTRDTMPVHDALLIPHLRGSSQNITTRDGINSARSKRIQMSPGDIQREKSPVYENAARFNDNEVKDILHSQTNFRGWLEPAHQMKMPKTFAKGRESQGPSQHSVIGEPRTASRVQHCILRNQTNVEIPRIERGLSTTEGSANHQAISEDTTLSGIQPKTLNHAKVTDQGEDTKQVLAPCDRCGHFTTPNKKQSTRDKFIRSSPILLGSSSNVKVSQSNVSTVSIGKHIPEKETTPKSPPICGVSTCGKTLPSNVRSQGKKSSHSEDKDSNGKTLDFDRAVNSEQENAGSQTKGRVAEISHSQLEKLKKVKIPRKVNTKQSKTQTKSKTLTRRCTPRNYICQFSGCSKTYCMRSHLVCHQRIHTRQRPYACSWRGCCMKFRRSDELSRHYRSHTGDKPYKCSFCVRAFSRSDHRKSHIRKIHNCDKLDSPYVI